MAYQFKIALAAAASALAFAAAPASAVSVVSACSPSDISPDAVACAGWYDGNLLNNSGTHVQDQANALATIGFVWDKDWTAINLTKISPTGSTYDFPGLLDGIAYIGIHKGKGGKDGFDGTAFFKLNADNLNKFALDLPGGSDAVLYSNFGGGTGGGGGGVPEPATWGMMMLGIGLMGGVMRRRQRQAVSYSFA
jgi:hypothetical protein